MTLPHRSEIAQALVDWFSNHGRDYPWRRTTEPWAVLVSEIMLQQTTIPTVLGRYEKWRGSNSQKVMERDLKLSGSSLLTPGHRELIFVK